MSRSDPQSTILEALREHEYLPLELMKRLGEEKQLPDASLKSAILDLLRQMKIEFGPDQKLRIRVEVPVAQGTDALSKLRELKGKWRRWAKRDCDPANGSAAAQQRGQLLANCADDLEALLPALEQRERELREILWMNHARYLPYTHIPYGDDGEMQCCGIDFKRDSPEDISAYLHKRAALNPTEPGGEK